MFILVHCGESAGITFPVHPWGWLGGGGWLWARFCLLHSTHDTWPITVILCAVMSYTKLTLKNAVAL